MHGMDDFEPEELRQHQLVILVVSTYEDNTPPVNAKFFYDWIMEAVHDFRVHKGELEKTYFAVYGCGNSLYEEQYNLVAKNVCSSSSSSNFIIIIIIIASVCVSVRRKKAFMAIIMLLFFFFFVPCLPPTPPQMLKCFLKLGGIQFCASGVSDNNISRDGLGTQETDFREWMEEHFRPAFHAWLRGQPPADAIQEHESYLQALEETEEEGKDSPDDPAGEKEEEEEEEEEAEEDALLSGDDVPEFSDPESGAEEEDTVKYVDPDADETDPQDNRPTKRKPSSAAETGDTLLDLEDLGQSIQRQQEQVKHSATGEGISSLIETIPVSTEEITRRPMLNDALRKNLTKQGYKLIGTHSGVKLCRWTKAMLRGRGGCYKHTFYGIESYNCMEVRGLFFFSLSFCLFLFAADFVCASNS